MRIYSYQQNPSINKIFVVLIVLLLPCAFTGIGQSNKQAISGIINDYTPVVAFNPCDNKIIVEDASAFKAGDTVLMIQMKGAEIDSSNAASFGTLTNYKNAGNYEFNYVKSKSGNIIQLKNNLLRSYQVPSGKVQLIRVPYYYTAQVTSKLTCLPWDGNKGGVLVLISRDTIDMKADIDVSGTGFKGGNSPNTGATTLFCFNNDFTSGAGTLATAAKGESIVTIGSDKAWGKGAPANGGGGGLGHNSGGGGGSNAGAGGLGGYQLLTCGNAPYDNRGIGGYALNYNNAQNKIFMGGGGGSGHVDNAGGSNMEGGNGGGIAIIISPVLQSNGFKILSIGGDATQCNFTNFTDCHDGSGGGGGGGVVLVQATNYINVTEINIKGGKGADLAIYNPSAGADKIGPGGGGGAGAAWFNSTSAPANITVIKAGGLNGGIIQNSNDPWGSTPGLDGTLLFDLKIPFDTVLYLKNIDSVRIKDSAISCSTFKFDGIAYTQGRSITTWEWELGDGSKVATQNVIHPYQGIGTYIVKLVIMDISGCKDSATITVTSTGIASDFSYKQDVCNPLSVHFSSIGNSPANPIWLFGDGNTMTGTANPIHLYTKPGTYIVRYVIQTGSCVDTIVKNILVDIIPEDVILTHDTTICFNSAKQLFTRPALSFCWSPTAYLSNPNAANPVTTTPVPATYYFTAEITGTNLIANGDFSAGNAGFGSQYTFANPTINEAEYFISTNPQTWSPLLSPCPDHTTGNGNMMLVNGAPVPNVNVWTQTVNVIPNTNYAFSTWIQAIFPPNPAELSFSINGGTLGNLITASLPTCTWEQFYTTWNSGNNTSATISIVNKNTFVQGNDFALDDISFSPVLIKRDSVKITIDSPQVKASNDTTVCNRITVQLNASGTSSYSWAPSISLSNSLIANPIATPGNTTQYIVSGTSLNGCTARDTVNVVIKPLPVITKSIDSTICRNTSVQLLAGGGSGYSWAPASSLINANAFNPVASPASNTTYVVTVTGTNSCTNTDSVKVAIRTLPTFSISPNKTTCINNNIVPLSAGGGTSYLWSPAWLVNDATISNPTSNATSTTTFTVKIKDKTCNDSTSLSTTVVISLPPVITAFKSSDIDCVISSAQLFASGAHTYTWTPATGLNNSTIPNPLASLTAPQQYVVTGIDTISNCSATTSITVLIKAPFEPTFFVPNAFSPNGDGLNDCFRVNHFGTVKSANISIYNRVGNRVFYSSDINDCWDGTFKNSPADAGNYVYYIKSLNDCGVNTKKGNLVLLR